MLDTPHITQTTTQLTAVIHLTIPREEIQNVMGPGISELMATIADQGIKPTGPWFDHHLKMAEDRWDFEISVPVSAPVVAAGRVKPSQWPAMKVARTVYHGPYEGLGDTWANSWTGLPQTGTHQPQTSISATSRDPSRVPTQPIGAQSSPSR